ncbi:uncharacterized protein LOC116260637 [Nymphaea colorata]|nr:uncharacterized protein LOC116260637 [Nymphaea colorata]
MGRPRTIHKHLPFLLLLLLLMIHGLPLSESQQNLYNVSAFFVLGDSSADTGNNNFIPTPFRSNWPPYGRDFMGGVPSGRFTNGKVGADYLISYLGLKETIPPYLDYTLGDEELLTGVNFASAGSGFDPLTAKISGVIPVCEQLDYMKEYIYRVEKILGREGTAALISNSLILIACGGNDFILNYFVLPVRRQKFNVEEYQDFVLELLRQTIQRLYDHGFRRMVVNGLSPLGCLPTEITTRNADDESRSCVEALNFVSAQYNTKLQAQLGRWTAEGLDGAKVAYGDTYNPFVELLTYPEKYGFRETKKGCCGTGLLETGPLCNPLCDTCTDPSSYIFWDSVHPSQEAFRLLSNDLFSTFLQVLQALLSEQVSEPTPRKMTSQRGVATASFVAVTVMALVASELAALAKAELVHDSWLRARLRRANVSCLLVFGDSSVDPGNNNVLNTTFKSNFLPYGINFAGHRPTGRFSNGRLTTDFIAEALGLGDAIPAFLRHNLTKQEFLHGFSFASAASGYDDLTANLHDVLPIRMQIQYLRHYIVQLRRVVGETRAQQVIKNSIAVLSSGTNDFIENYFLNPDRRKQFSVDRYTDFLVECMARDIQEIHRLGGERFAVVAVPPLGCMPLVRALYGRSKCVAEINEVVMEFNSKIKAKLATVDQWLSDHVRGAFVDAYTVLLRAVESPTRYGFSVSSKGCCGSGVMEFGTTCRGLSTCSQPSKYVFWDAVHPTESMYRVIAIEAIKEVYKILL